MTRTSEQSESDLLRRIASGDEDAFRAIYRRHQGPVYRFAKHMSGDATVAEDVTQEVFMTLIDKRARFDAGRGSLQGYLIGMARNLVLRSIDRGKRFVALPEAETLSADAPQNGRVLSTSTQSDPVRAGDIERLRRAVLSLPPDYREAVVLCELEEMSYEEAARILDCPIGTVRSRLHRARALLAEKLREARGPEPRASAAARPALGSTS
jgi:RNA polymerase sigma-70 factor (ECF subfamily)